MHPITDVTDAAQCADKDNSHAPETIYTRCKPIAEQSNNLNYHAHTIAAIATASGVGAVGIVRVSGTLVPKIIDTLLHKTLQPRYAHYGPLYSDNDAILDYGIAIYFPAPHSYTGEHVLELQVHGGSIILNLLLQQILSLGVQLAEPGEFSKRAFLNGKIDLTQAEAVMDIINASSVAAAKAAVRNLTGVFADQIQQLIKKIISLRVHVEACLDFAEEEINFLADDMIQNKLHAIKLQLKNILDTANQGKILHDGLSIAIIGKPNAGKSSLLNILTRNDVAIVTAIAGTTRDVLRSNINCGGIAVEILDTAGLRDTDDYVELEGIKRTKVAMLQANLLLLVVDESTLQYEGDQIVIEEIWPLQDVAIPSQIIIILNKADISNKEMAVFNNQQNITCVRLSLLQQELAFKLVSDVLIQHIEKLNLTENSIIARTRHILALTGAYQHMQLATDHLLVSAGELVAEELSQAQRCLAVITGEFTADDLLGEIFASFCIGK